MKNNQKTSTKEFIIYLLVLIPIIFFDKHPILKWIAILIISGAIVYGCYLFICVKRTEKEIINSIKSHENIQEIFEEVEHEIENCSYLTEKDKKKASKELETLKEKSKSEKHRIGK